jgi:hypothetical protein
MSNVTFKVALTNAKFPLLLNQGTQEVLDPGMDVAPRVNPAFVGGINSVDWNLIQVAWASNMIPTEKGYRSFSTRRSAAAWPVAMRVKDAVSLRDVVNSYFFSAVVGTLTSTGAPVAYVSPTGLDTGYIADAGFVLPGFDTVRSVIKLFSGDVNDRVFVLSRYSAALGVDKSVLFELTTKSFVVAAPVLPAGIALDDIVCMFSASNYLVLCTASLVLWSTPANPLDFSTVTLGAGSQSPVDLVSMPITGAAIAGGFVLYTAQNGIAAFFSNAAAVPFSFRGIAGCGGIEKHRAVATEVGSQYHYISGKRGIQRVSLQRAEYLLGHVQDAMQETQMPVVFSAASYPVLASLNARNATADAILTLFDSRYLLINPSAFSSLGLALLYDLHLERTAWTQVPFGGPGQGAVISVPATPASGNTNRGLEPLSSMHWFPETLVAGSNGVHVSVPWSDNLVGSPLSPVNGALIVGPIRIRRANRTTVTEVNVTRSRGDAPFRCYAWPADNGADFSGAPVQMVSVESTDSFERFQGRITSDAVYLAFDGDFAVTAVTVQAQRHGIR